MMDTTQSFAAVDRRTVIRGLGGLAVAGSLAGCATDGGGGSGDGGSDGGSGDGGSGGGNAEVDEYLSDTSNYDGTIEDMTGQDEVTVEVGVQANGGAYGFGPAAISVDQGTTVVWEWTGEGSIHNVSHEDGEFQSERTGEVGFTFEFTFEDSGTYLYVCEPHSGLNMNGAVVVE